MPIKGLKCRSLSSPAAPAIATLPTPALPLEEEEEEEEEEAPEATSSACCLILLFGNIAPETLELFNTPCSPKFRPMEKATKKITAMATTPAFIATTTGLCASRGMAGWAEWAAGNGSFLYGRSQDCCHSAVLTRAQRQVGRVAGMSGEAILSAVASLYERLPPGCKAGSREYTVLSAIVAVIPAVPAEGGLPLVEVLSLGTGTKCAGKALVAQDTGGRVISDSHAEVIARRGLIRLLLECCLLLSRETTDCVTSIASERLFPLERHYNDGKRTMYRLKKDWELVLFISENPCGDAAIMEAELSVGNSSTACEGNNTTGAGESPSHRGSNNSRLMVSVFTGAKVVTDPSSSSAESSWMREEGRQRTGVLRTKSGRSDIKPEHRSESHCCSDKICRWNFIGLQGGLLSHYLDDLILGRIVVLPDPAAPSIAIQHEALVRALVTRLTICNGTSSSSDGNSNDGGSASGMTPNPNLKVEVLSELSPPAALQHLHRKRAINSTGAATLTPQGVNVNWIKNCMGSGSAVVSNSNRAKAVSGGSVEVCQSATGALQGSTKSSAGQASSASRLCRRSLATLFADILAAPTASNSGLSLGSGDAYNEWKAAAVHYQSRKAVLLGRGVFQSWMVREAASTGAFCVASDASDKRERQDAQVQDGLASDAKRPRGDYQ